MTGPDALVPPYTCQPDLPWYLATPVLGSAAAETSATALPGHEVPVVGHGGFAFLLEHPLPDPVQADSVQPRALLDLFRLVPATAITVLQAAGVFAP